MPDSAIAAAPLCRCEAVNKFIAFMQQYAAADSGTGRRWLGFLIGIGVSFLLALLCDLVIRKVLKRLTAKTKNVYDDHLVEALHKPLVFGLSASGIFWSTGIFTLSAKAELFIRRAYLALIIILVLTFLLKAVNIIVAAFRSIAKKTVSTYDDLLINLLSPLCKTVIWVLGGLFFFDNVFGLNIASLLAGAGIAAMAVAFAAQNTIANIFGAVSLIIDRPFQIGDRIKINDKDGTVEGIGLRSTRMRALDGTLWNIPNRNITDSPILNLSVRPNYKVVFVIGLTFETTTAQLQRGKEILHEILDKHPLTDMKKKPPVITFETINSCSLDLQAVCWMQTTDFATYSRAKDEINFQIMERFTAAGLDMAFPTQTLYLKNDGAKPA